MNIKKLKIICKLITVSFFLLVGVPTARAVEGSSLAALIDEAVANNPGVKGAYNNWKAAEYKTRSVKGLDDPVASYGFFPVEVQTRVGPQEQKFGVSQKIPFPGKLSLKGKAQAKHAGMLREQFEAAENEVIKKVKFVYFDLFFNDQAIRINEEEKAILEKMEKVAQRKYESNLIPQQDVIKLQVELSKIIRKILLLDQNRKSLSAKLNSLLSRPQNTSIERVLEIESVSFDLGLDEVLDRVRTSRQELIAAELSVEKAEYERSLAWMAYLPDFTVGAEYIDIGRGTTSAANDGRDAWMGKVSVNVPIWFGKLNSQVKEKEASLLAAKNGKEELENNVEFEAQDIYFKIDAYKNIIVLYESALLPQAQQAFDVSQIGFETGSISFLDWLDTERTYLQTRLAYFKAVTDHHRSIAYLERVVGGDLSGGKDED